MSTEGSGTPTTRQIKPAPRSMFSGRDNNNKQTHLLYISENLGRLELPHISTEHFLTFFTISHRELAPNQLTKTTADAEGQSHMRVIYIY